MYILWRMLLPFFLSLFTFIINSSSSHHSFFFYFQLYKQFLSSYLIQFFLLFTLYSLFLSSLLTIQFFLLITLFALIPLFLSHHTGFFFSTFYLIHSSSYFSFFYFIHSSSSYLTIQFFQLFALFTLSSHISVFFSTFYTIHSSNHSFFSTFYIIHSFLIFQFFLLFTLFTLPFFLSHKYSGLLLFSFLWLICYCCQVAVAGLTHTGELLDLKSWQIKNLWKWVGQKCCKALGLVRMDGRVSSMS